VCHTRGRTPFPTAYFTSSLTLTRTRTNTNPNDTEANAAGRSGNARALRKQSKCGVHHEGEGRWPKFSQKLQIAKSEAFVGSAHSAETDFKPLCDLPIICQIFRDGYGLCPEGSAALCRNGGRSKESTTKSGCADESHPKDSGRFYGDVTPVCAGFCDVSDV